MVTIDMEIIDASGQHQFVTDTTAAEMDLMKLTVVCEFYKTQLKQ